MNKLSRYSFLITIVTLSITFRISHIYVGGGDSWGMATYVSALTQSGTLSWLLHPLSYLGLFPYSYPSGGIVFVAAFSLMTDLNILQNIALYSILTSILGILGVYILLREVHSNENLVLLSVAFYSTYIWFVVNTWNRIGMRSLFVVLYPIALFIWLRLENRSHSRFSLYTVGLILSIILATVHRLFLFYGFLILLPFTCIKIVTIINNVFRLDLKLNKYGINARTHSIHMIYILSIIFLFLESLGIQIYGTSEELSYSLREGRQHNFLGEGTFIHTLINLGLDFAAYYTITVYFIAFGIFYIMLKQYHLNKNLYFVMVLIFSVPFVYDIKYFLSFAGPLSILFFSFGLNFFYEKFRDGRINFELTFYLFYIISFMFILFHGYNKNSDPFLLYAIMFISLAILINSVRMRQVKYFKKKFWAVSTGLLLISVCQTMIVTIYHSENYINENERDLDYNSLPSYWIRDNKINNWVSFKISEDLVISTLSEERMMGSQYNFYDNRETYDVILNAEFNITRMLGGYPFPYDFDYSQTYEEEFLPFNVISRNDRNIGSYYDIQYTVHTVNQIETYDAGEDKLDIIPYQKNNSFIVYQSEQYIIYKY